MKCEVQQKACQNMSLKRSKTQPGTSPNSPKSRPGASLGAKMHPKGASDQPRDAQERPRSAQETPKKRPRGTKSRPRAPKSRPSNAQEAPKSVPDPFKMSLASLKPSFEHDLCGKLCSIGSRNHLMLFFFLRMTHVMCFKPWKNLGFSYVFAYPELVRI